MNIVILNIATFGLPYSSWEPPYYCFYFGDLNFEKRLRSEPQNQTEAL